MRIHPRELQCKRAEADLCQAVLEIVQRHDLTDAEALRVVIRELGGFVSSVAKYAIRDERHGDTDKPGGLE